MSPSPTALSDEVERPANGSALELAIAAAQSANSKTTEDTIILDVGSLLGITDYFVVTAGRNDRQVRAIVDEVAKGVRDAGGTTVRRVEGFREAEWVLVDYGSFVVHVFSNDARDRFSLERLWADAPRVQWDLPVVSRPAPAP